MVFRVPVVRDKLVYNDKNDKSKGYSVKDGSSKLTTQTVNLQKGRGKKKDLKQGKEEGVNYNHRSNLFSNSRVVSTYDLTNKYITYVCFTFKHRTNTLINYQN